MISKKIIFGTICAGLLFARLFALSSCQANSEENFQYNLTPRNPIDNEVLPLESVETENKNINQNQQVPTINNPVVTNAQREEYVYTVSRPEWWEFCPIEYENPVYHKIALSNAQLVSNDWFKLKKEFEKYISTCDGSQGHQRDLCYSRVRNKFSYRVQNFVPEREKWAKNFMQAQIQGLKIDAMESAIKNKNTHMYMFSDF